MYSILLLFVVFSVLFNLDMLIRRLRPYPRITYDDLEKVLIKLEDSLELTSRPVSQGLTSTTVMQIKNGTKECVIFTRTAQIQGGFVEILDICVPRKERVLLTFVEDELMELKWNTSPAQHTSQVAAWDYNKAHGLLVRVRELVKLNSESHGGF